MKKTLFFFLIFIIFFEITSVIFTKLELFLFNDTPKYSFEKTSVNDWLVKDDKGNPSHKKNYKTTHVSRCFDVEYIFNNVGARDNNDYFINDSEKSIMLIGDSFAEGFGVDTEKTFAKIIENKINKKVLNFGVSGTNTEQQTSSYINLGSKLNFDELIYFFLPHNDYSKETQELENPQNDKKNVSFSIFNLDTIKYKLFFYKFNVLDILARFTYSYNFIRSAAHLLDLNSNNNFKNLSYFFNNKENITYTFNFLENLINYKNVKSYIFIIPTIYDINNFQKNKINYKNLYWYKEINKIAKKNNSTLIDLMDFIDFNEKHVYFHSCDGHWNEYGNKFVADIFLEKYSSNY